MNLRSRSEYGHEISNCDSALRRRVRPLSAPSPAEPTAGPTAIQKPPAQTQAVPVVITSDYYAQPKVLVLHALNHRLRLRHTT
jgi:hypothetical protein